MEILNEIPKDYLDILKEVGNVGAGHAATALSKLLDKKIEMKVPNVSVMTFNEMIEMAGGAEKIVASVYLRIQGDSLGHLFFVLPIEHANMLIQQLTRQNNIAIDQLPYHEMALSALQELGNILAGSYLSALSDFTGLCLYPTVPATSIDMLGAIISYGFIELSQFSDYVISIDTVLVDMHEEDKKYEEGHFFLMPDLDTFDSVFRSLGVGVDE
jgi:chemotaxis protein CheC